MYGYAIMRVYAKTELQAWTRWTRVVVTILRSCASVLFVIAALFWSASGHAQGSPQIVRIALSEASPPTSYLENGEIKGMFKEVMALLFTHLPGYKPVFQTFPWPRAQLYVMGGEMDMFCTFPSDSRIAYADFVTDATFVWDYGYLVYDLANPKRQQIENARSFEDLRGLLFVSQEKVEWEQENVPAFIARYFVNAPHALLHMTFLRKSGDFFIMSPEQAVYYARQLGYERQLGMRKAAFIPNSQVRFHIGIRKTYPAKAALLAALEAAAQSPEYLARKRLIEKRYMSVLSTQ